MRIVVANIGPEPRLVEFPSASSVPDLPGLESILYVPVPWRASVVQLDQMVNQRIDPAARRITDLVVLRMHKADADRLRANPDACDAIDHRFEGKPVIGLTCDVAGHKLFPIGANPTIIPNERVGAFFEALRQADLWAIAGNHGAILPVVPEFHYEGPGGGHYRSFLRVGTATQSADDAASFAFWIAPFIRSKQLILLDSWTIQTIGLTASRYAADLSKAAVNPAKFSGGEQLQSEPELPFEPPDVECLRSYDEPTEEVLRRVAQLGSLSQVLVLSSVTSAGFLIDRVSKACEKEKYAVEKIALYAAPSAPKNGETVFCTLPVEFGRLSVPCELCTSGARSSYVRIDKATYLLDIAAAVEHVKITINEAKPAKDVIERYKGSGAFSLHRHQHDSLRHHMIHVDVEKMFSVSGFEARLADAVAPLRDRVDAVVAPDHGAARRVAEFVCGLTRGKLLVCDETDLGSLNAESRSTLERAQRIVVADDVLISGARLVGFKNALRRGGFIRQDTEVSLCVGIARTSSEASLRGFEDMLGRGRLLAAESLILPNWHAECPWCWELAQIKRSSLDCLTPKIVERFEALQDMHRGLTDGAFLEWGDGTDALKLGPTSIFGEGLNTVELFVSVASTLQRLRSSKKLNETSLPPVARVLAPDASTAGRFYDLGIAAAVLRGARRHDLRTASTEGPLLAWGEQRTGGEVVAPLRAEFALAVASGKVPQIPGLKERVAQSGESDEGTRSFLIQLLSRSIGT